MLMCSVLKDTLVCVNTVEWVNQVNILFIIFISFCLVRTWNLLVIPTYTYDYCDGQQIFWTNSSHLTEILQPLPTFPQSPMWFFFFKNHREFVFPAWLTSLSINVLTIPVWQIFFIHSPVIEHRLIPSLGYCE